MSKDKKSFEVKPEDLGGFTIDQIKCRACSGYGNCGYRMYRMHEGKPVLLCNRQKQELQAQKDQAELGK